MHSMTDDASEKLFIALASVTIGWVLAQGSTLLKEWWDRRRLKRAIDQEIELIADQLKGVVPTYMRLIALDAHGVLEPTIPRRLQNYLFNDHYAKVALGFNHAQRLQLQAIHGYVEEINANVEELKTLSLELARKHLGNQITAIELSQYRQMLEQHTHVLMDAGWQIMFYKQNRKNPQIIPGGGAHESRVKVLSEIQGWISELREAALAKSRQEVSAVYHPAEFSWPHLRPKGGSNAARQSETS